MDELEPTNDAGLDPAGLELTESAFEQVEGQKTDRAENVDQVESTVTGQKQEATAPVAAPEKFQYGGKEYTLEELTSQGVLAKALATAGQLPTMQSKAQELQAKVDALEGQLRAPRQEQPQQPSQPPVQLTPAQIAAHYGPQLDKAVEGGWIDPDFVAAFPTLAPQMLMYRDLLIDARQAIGVLVANAVNQSQSGTMEREVGRIRSDMQTLSGEHEFFREIATDEGFIKHLADLNVPLDRANKEFLAKEWIGYRAYKDGKLNLPASTSPASATTPQPRTAKRSAPPRTAMGESTGSRPGGRPEPAPWEDLLQDARA